MKIAVIGTGKTGGALLELANQRFEAKGYSRSQPVSAAELESADCAIVFVPASGLADLAPLLIESGKPVVCGTTGFPYETLPAFKAPWIVGSNFSLGMNAAFLVAKLLAKLPPPASFHVHEVHHVTKKDSPSGTALYLQGLLPKGTEVSAERLGDARGLHRLDVQLAGETLTLQHEAHDRGVFASGALFAAEKFLPALNPGLHRFETLMEEFLKEELIHA